ncbi:ANM_collapsed_G0047360.mRNA.1.CDS.1 [Saccharomyces cerevisiae]|nr:ANM_collapsed_G0047360.mRNA.1.CDS.1 [Saccharomyces cerevisiae]
MLPLSIEQRRPSRSPEYDQSTLSNYKDFAVLHTDLNLSVSFEKSAISGSVTFQLKKLHEGKNKSDELHLDTSYLDVQEVHIDGSKADFQIEQRKEPLGSRLVINNASCNDNFTLNIQFRTTDKCTALQWLNSKQTKGGKPYVFSQLEAIHARSLFPCFDTPSVKSTFTASIESPLPVVFSGIRIEDTSKDTNIYRFEQKVPIPAYLIGIASGDLSSAPIGPRSTVYTEPFRLKDCQWEFENDVEKFIQTAEKIIFEYEWGTYDILVNVDSYPYGGMESPNMTFATPTLIAHDRSNIDVIAHELAHSWSGNLVTNCSWNHFWLNEGWTVYLERRIIGAIHGEPTRHFSALIGWSDLQNSIDSMRDPERFSTLVQNLNDNTDPDDAFSTVPYEKGFNLLFHLETILGGKAEFDPFIRHYFKKFAKKSLDTFQFLDTLYEFYRKERNFGFR